MQNVMKTCSFRKFDCFWIKSEPYSVLTNCSYKESSSTKKNSKMINEKFTVCGFRDKSAFNLMPNPFTVHKIQSGSVMMFTNQNICVHWQ